MCSHSTASTNDYNGDFDEDSLADDCINPGTNFQRSGIYSTYPPKGNLKKKDPLSQRLLVHTPLDESLSETSEYQSDNGGYGHTEDFEDVSVGPVSSTPQMKRKNGRVRKRLDDTTSEGDGAGECGVLVVDCYIYGGYIWLRLAVPGFL